MVKEIRLMKAILLLAFFSASVFAQNFGAVQQQDSAATGLAAGQTAKLSVYYPTIPAPVAQVLAAVRLVIQDENRNVLAAQDFQIAGGQIVSISVDADSLLPQGQPSVQIHGMTQTAGGAADAFPLVISGLDIVDKATGKTVIHLDAKVTYPRS